jgi:hypothetical protein
MSPISTLYLACLLYGFRNALTWRDVKSVVLVTANTLINEAIVTDGATLNSFALWE